MCTSPPPSLSLTLVPLFACLSRQVSATVAWVTIDGTAHCRDMYAPDVFAGSGNPDTEAVKWAHSRISANVAAYLAD